MPPDLAARVSEGVVRSAIEGATWEGQLVTVPFWANTQLLWYKKSVAQAAGLDMSQPVTWDQLMEAAQSQKTLIAAQGRRAESLVVWVNALIESAGGSIIEQNAPQPENIVLGLDTPAAARAAEVMQRMGTSGLGGPAFSTAGEDENATMFENGSAAFMVNWPFVWPRALSAVEDGTLDAAVPQDFGWALYPQVDADKESRPPYGGINLGVGAFSAHPDLAYEAAECITTPENRRTTSSATATRPRRHRSSTTPRCSRSSRWPPSSASRSSWPRHGRRPPTTARSPAASSASTTRRPRSSRARPAPRPPS